VHSLAELQNEIVILNAFMSLCGRFCVWWVDTSVIHDNKEFLLQFPSRFADANL